MPCSHSTRVANHVYAQVVYPGAYRSVCVRLEVQHLAVAAVANSALLGELEGAASAESAAGVGPAFKVLRSLVQTWLQDARDRGSRCLSSLLESFCSEDGRCLVVQDFKGLRCPPEGPQI